MSVSQLVYKNIFTGEKFDDFFTNINGDLIPSTDLTYDLGSVTKRWDQCYFNVINFGNSYSQFVISDNVLTNTITAGNVNILGAPKAQTGNILYFNNVTGAITFDIPTGGGGGTVSDYARVFHTTNLALPIGSLTTIPLASIAGEISSNFSLASNILTYNGATTKRFRVIISFQFQISGMNMVPGTCWIIPLLNGNQISDGSGLGWADNLNNTFGNRCYPVFITMTTGSTLAFRGTSENNATTLYDRNVTVGATSYSSIPFSADIQEV